MCVIMIKPIGVEMPKEELWRDMWDSNDDGAGYMYALKNRVFIEKGFMTYQTFKKSVEATIKRVEKIGLKVKQIPFIMHFRITTHGGTSKENTHPFPVSPRSSDLKKLSSVTDLAVAHNGIISSVTAGKEVSDTMQYIMDILAPLKEADERFYEKQPLQTLICNTVGASRLAFLDNMGKINTVGTFEKSDDKEYEGLMFSNLNHEWSGYTVGWGKGYKYDDYDYSYSGSKDYNTRSTYKEVLVNIPVKELPKGVALIPMAGLNKQMNLTHKRGSQKFNDIAKIIGISRAAQYYKGELQDRQKFYVDVEGDIMVSYNGNGGNEEMPLALSYYYDYALYFPKEDSDDYEVLTAFSKELDNVPLKYLYLSIPQYKVSMKTLTQDIFNNPAECEEAIEHSMAEFKEVGSTC